MAKNTIVALALGRIAPSNQAWSGPRWNRRLGRRTLRLSYPNYLNAEHGKCLPKIERLERLIVALGIEGDAEETRALLRAYLVSLGVSDRLLGLVAHPVVAPWLETLLGRLADLPAPAALSLGRALAQLERADGVSRFLRELARRPALRRANRDFYRYWLRDALPTPGTDGFEALQGASWDKTSHWLTLRLRAPEHSRLRRIYAFTFLDLWDSLGPPSACPLDARTLARRIAAERVGGR